jgi:hypothetical protein
MPTGGNPARVFFGFRHFRDRGYGPGRLAGDRDRNLPVVHAHPEMRDQSALDVPYGLLGRKFRRRQNVDLVDRTGIPGNDPGRNHTRKRRDQILGTLQRENAARDR